MFNNNKIKRNWLSSDAKKYLTFTANTAGSTLKLSSFHEDSIVYNGTTYTVPAEYKCPYLISLVYSTDGITWHNYSFYEVYDESDNLIGYDGQVITLANIGDYVIIKASNSNNLHPTYGGWCKWYNTSSDPSTNPPTGWYQFVLTGSLAASGNIQSLANKRLLTSIGFGQYYRLFKNCTQLTYAPYLGSRLLTQHCYREMFMGCTNLTEVHSETELINNGGASYDFVSMFEGCTSLTYFSDIHIGNSTTYRYGSDSLSRMFFGCTSLVRIPLYTTALDEVGNSSYVSTFEGCTSIVDASEYIMYNTVTHVYRQGQRTFYGCTHLAYAPYLDKWTLDVSSGNGNSRQMFDGCSALKEIIYSSDELPQNVETSESWLRNWVNGVSATGNFFIGKNCPKIYSKHFIPYGWDINEIDDRPLCFETETADNSVMLAKVGEPYEWKGLQYSTDGTTWQDYEFNTWVGMPNIGDKVYFRSIDRSNGQRPVYVTTNDYYRFSLKGNAKCSGNIFSIVRYLGTKVDFDEEYFLGRIFQSCNITTIPTIPDIRLYQRTLTYAFSGTNIREVTLDMKNLASNALGGLFNQCKSLTKAQVFIRKKNLTAQRLYGLFRHCSQLSRIEVYFDSWSSDDSLYIDDAPKLYTYLNWVEGVAASGVFVCPKGLTEKHDVSHIPVGWTVKRWYQEMGEQYPSVALLMQQYTDLEDVVDTYPNVAAILDQYPNLVHSLVDTGLRPYVTFGTGMWKVDVYPHNYMEATLHYNKVASDNCFGIFSRRGNYSQGLPLSLFQDSTSKVQMLFGANGSTNNQQGVTRYGGTGEHEMYISKDSATFDGVETVKDTQIKLGDFDATYYLSDKIQIEGNSDKSGTTTTAKFYSLKIKEYGTLTHHFVPVADGVIADIADLDNIKVYTKDDATSIFGTETIQNNA